MAIKQEFIAPDKRNKAILPINANEETTGAKPFSPNSAQMEKIAQATANKIKRKKD